VPYRIELAPAAQRELRRLPREIQARLAAPIQALAENPRPANVRKLRGQDHTWRVRVGTYRIIYDIHDEEALVVVLKVDRCRETTYRL
jgi:mRNA interferase RelE/StbE